MIKKLIKSVIVKILNFDGKGTSSLVTIDKMRWEPYYKPNHKMNLYFKGLKNAGVEWDDSFYKQLKFYSLQNMVYHVLSQELSGDFAECGVWKGHSAYVISSILSINKFAGDFHIFDSFEGGLSKKVENDKNLRAELTEKQIQIESNKFKSTKYEVKSCLSNFKFTHLYKGWIPECFNEVESKQFQFLHIDVDLYEPTKDSLNFFYPRLVENGVIVCDDYGSCIFPGTTKAVDEFLGKNNCKMFYEVPMGSCFIIK